MNWSALIVAPAGLVAPECNVTLIYDDYNGIYVWVDVNNHDDELSPHFDYEEDAVQWRQHMEALLKQ
jgi:hypothetical protein